MMNSRRYARNRGIFCYTLTDNRKSDCRRNYILGLHHQPCRYQWELSFAADRSTDRNYRRTNKLYKCSHTSIFLWNWNTHTNTTSILFWINAQDMMSIQLN